MMISRHGSHWKARPYSFIGFSQLGHRGVIALTSARLIREANIVNELSPDELNSVTGGTGKTPPKPTTPEPPTPKEQVTFEYGGLRSAIRAANN
jgi:hypothetical protein